MRPFFMGRRRRKEELNIMERESPQKRWIHYTKERGE